ncbi:MAG: cell division protein FtsH, partial [Micropepsaceae bacterium]
AYQNVKRILTEKRDDLEALAKGLLEYETLTGDEIKALLAGHPPVRTPYDEPPPDSHRPAATVPQTGKPRGEDAGPAIDPNPEPQPGT